MLADAFYKAQREIAKVAFERARLGDFDANARDMTVLATAVSMMLDAMVRMDLRLAVVESSQQQSQNSDNANGSDHDTT
jgi:hypothetical protein